MCGYPNLMLIYWTWYCELCVCIQPLLSAMTLARLGKLFTNYCEIFSRILKRGSCTLRLQLRVRSSTSNLSQCLIDEKLNSCHNYNFKRRIRQISNHLKGIPLTVEKFSLAGLYCSNPLEIILFGIRVQMLNSKRNRVNCSILYPLR